MSTGLLVWNSHESLCFTPILYFPEEDFPAEEAGELSCKGVPEFISRSAQVELGDGSLQTLKCLQNKGTPSGPESPRFGDFHSQEVPVFASLRKI